MIHFIDYEDFGWSIKTGLNIMEGHRLSSKRVYVLRFGHRAWEWKYSDATKRWKLSRIWL